MSSGEAAFRRIQAAARSAAAKNGTNAPTQEYLIRHALESFLHRLTQTSHHGDFVLKGGILLAAYGARRPTRDADSNAVSADVTAEQLAEVVRDIAEMTVDDGMVFDLDTINIQFFNYALTMQVVQERAKRVVPNRSQHTAAPEGATAATCVRRFERTQESSLVLDRPQRRRRSRHLHDQPSPTVLHRYEVKVFVKLISRIVYRVDNDEPTSADFGRPYDLVECVKN